MEENQEDELLDKDIVEQVFDSEISDLNHLVNTILDYYTFAHSTEEGEEWKKGTNYENKVVPDDVNSLVGMAFKSQLKKFIKK
jgi:hypothetical protein